VAALIALAKGRPGALTFGSSGTGSSNHLAGEVFRAVAGIELTHVPYRGNAEMTNDLLAGRLDMVFSGLPPVLPLVQAGTLRPLVVSGPARLAAIPEVPTVAEAGLAGAEAISFYGVVAPAGTPAPVLTRLGEALRAVLGREEVRSAFRSLGSEAQASTAAEFAALIAAEREKWGGVIRRFNIKPP
jgi:tripartite-type tricarboxylate transporter receptor subunit TctC